MYAKIPTGTAQSLTYGAYDPNAGLVPGQVAILFLDYNIDSIIFGNVPCPVAAALAGGVAGARHRRRHRVPRHDRHAGRRVSDAAVRRRQGGRDGRIAADPDERVAVELHRGQRVGRRRRSAFRSTSVVRRTTSSRSSDNTTVTMRPISAIAAGSGVAAGAGEHAVDDDAQRGQYVQLTQSRSAVGQPDHVDRLRSACSAATRSWTSIAAAAITASRCSRR